MALAELSNELVGRSKAMRLLWDTAHKEVAAEKSKLNVDSHKEGFMAVERSTDNYSGIALGKIMIPLLDAVPSSLLEENPAPTRICASVSSTQYQQVADFQQLFTLQRMEIERLTNELAARDARIRNVETTLRNQIASLQLQVLAQEEEISNINGSQKVTVDMKVASFQLEKDVAEARQQHAEAEVRALHAASISNFELSEMRALAKMEAEAQRQYLNTTEKKLEDESKSCQELKFKVLEELREQGVHLAESQRMLQDEVEECHRLKFEVAEADPQVETQGPHFCEVEHTLEVCRTSTPETWKELEQQRLQLADAQAQFQEEVQECHKWKLEAAEVQECHKWKLEAAQADLRVAKLQSEEMRFADPRRLPEEEEECYRLRFGMAEAKNELHSLNLVREKEMQTLTKLRVQCCMQAAAFEELEQEAAERISFLKLKQETAELELQAEKATQDLEAAKLSTLQIELDNLKAFKSQLEKKGSTERSESESLKSLPVLDFRGAASPTIAASENGERQESESDAAGISLDSARIVCQSTPPQNDADGSSVAALDSKLHDAVYGERGGKENVIKKDLAVPDSADVQVSATAASVFATGAGQKPDRSLFFETSCSASEKLKLFTPGRQAVSWSSAASSTDQLSTRGTVIDVGADVRLQFKQTGEHSKLWNSGSRPVHHGTSTNQSIVRQRSLPGVGVYPKVEVSANSNCGRPRIQSAERKIITQPFIKHMDPRFPNEPSQQAHRLAVSHAFGPKISFNQKVASLHNLT
eukprot:gnl/MRDRNA2_/MRDRNA2_82302_c0_seq2.p1 gnl/MRDRNA2_/MRDRNA2_82302_c0~~gnl/MRDRNA2_/MRDRNA2_82302_c0_seq2.p1  ORF type:complete len:761 (+),score=220.70 gnl/MRDRNA2_/MRDRNA2_82302_c0_seq2:102-2384(+)